MSRIVLGGPRPATHRRPRTAPSTARRFVTIVAVTILSVLAALLAAVQPASAHESYTVRSGDTLSHIAVRNGVTVSALMEANALVDPDRIRIGQILQIPHGSGGDGTPVATPQTTQAEPAATSAAASYTVVAGDTLSQIAVRFGVARAELQELNAIRNPHRIRVGQVLDLPAAGVETAAGVGRRYPDILERVRTNSDHRALIPVFERWAEANAIPVDLLMAVAWHESGWNNEALSNKGALGIGQIMPATGAWVASDLIGRPDLDRADPEDNIRMSARYLRWLIDYLGDEELAIAGYYQGPGAVKAGRWYSSTDLYVASVQAHRPLFTAS